MFIARLMNFGTLPALLISKAIAIFLITVVIVFERKRLLRRLNIWFAILVTWNFVMIFAAARN